MTRSTPTLTTRQLAALALVCDGDLPPIGPTLAATLAELFSMGMITNSPIRATAYGRRFRADTEIDAADRRRERGE